MRINANQLFPIIFPPGAGGHFFFNLLTIHPDVMPMGKDQCMKKLFEDKNLDDSVARFKLTVPKDHSMWQDIESHDYYIAPPRFDDPNDSANWIVEDDSITTEGDDYFLNKVNKYWYRYGVVVHNVEQFPLLHKIKKQIMTNVSPRHVPAKIITITDIPRTKNGKIVELAVKNIIDGNEIKNKEALLNPEVLELFKNLEELNY